MSDIVINKKKLNPIGFHLMKLMQDKTIRNIILYGGSSSGKTFSVAQMILIFTMHEGTNHLVMKKVGAHIKDTVYKSFKSAAEQLGITGLFKFTDGTKTITCLDNDAQIVFKGLDDSEKIKGLESFKRVFLDEMNGFIENDYMQVRKRLRGMEGQQIIGAFNPDKETSWIKKKIFDIEPWDEKPMELVINGSLLPIELTTVKSIRYNRPKMFIHAKTKEPYEHPSDTVLIQSTYLNNFWVVGSPDGTYGYYDEQCVADFEKDRINYPDFYNVYALGEWGVIRTGSEFFSSFERANHTSEVSYNPSLPIHVSIDNNRLPYIAIQFWQASFVDGVHLWQFHEICAESPNNTARKAGKLAAEYLNGLGPEKVFLHGDASTRSGNTIDDDNRSFLDLFLASMKKSGIDAIDKVGNNNPSVAMTGEFINAIFDGALPGLKITIGDTCRVSIEDYQSVQKDANGAILKVKVKNPVTGQSYEEHGHLSDAFRYVCHDVMNSQYIEFANRRKRNLYASDGYIHFFNPQTECRYSDDLLYCMPNINGKLVFVNGKKCGDKWHVVSVGFVETSSSDEIKSALEKCGSNRIIIECSKSYYTMARELRDEMKGDIRVLHESGDIPRRIAATSDFVKSTVLFNETSLNEDLQYSDFMTNLLDYNRNSGENIEASAVLSGFIQVILKLGL